MTPQIFLQLGIVLFAIVFAAQALRFWLLERRAKKWARLRGRIIEAPPPPLPERYGQSSLDTQFFLEYEVEGHLYRHRAHETSVSFRGITLWRKPPAPQPWVHYNRDNPKEHFCENDKGMWKLFLAFALALAVPLLYIAQPFSGQP